MPRYDPPESGARRSSAGRMSYSDPPAYSPHDMPEIVLIPEGAKDSYTQPETLSSTDSNSTRSPPPPPPPPLSDKKERGNALTVKQDDKERRQSGDSSMDSEDLPESLMETYTLSADSNPHRRHSSILRKANHGTPTKMSTPTKKNASASRELLENLPTTPRSEGLLGETSNRERNTTPQDGKTPNSGTPHGSTYLTRKAHKFSSLKKKRGATNLLHRLFCSPKDEEGATTGDSSDPTPTVALADSEENNEDSPHESKDIEKENLNDDKDDPDSGCMSLNDVMERAKDTFLLTAEADVRVSIQTAVQDALVAVGATPKAKKKESANFDEDVRDDGKEDESLLTSIFDHWKRKSTMGSGEDGAETPSWKAKAQAAARRNTAEKKKVLQTPKPPIPTPGTKALFPSTIQYWEAVTTGKQTPTKRPNFEDDIRDPPPQSPFAKKAKDMKSLLSEEENEGMENTVSHSASIFTAPSDEPGAKSPASKRDGPPTDDDAAFLPDDFAQPSTSHKEQIDQAVAQARKKWGEKELAVLRKQMEDEFTKERDVTFAEMSAAEQAKWKAMEKERKKSLESVEAERQRKLDEIEQEMAKLLEIQKEHLDQHTPKEESERQLRELRLQLQAEKDVEVRTLKTQFERKLGDQKEQLAVVQRKNQSKDALVEQYSKKSEKHEQEIATLQAELETKKDVPTKVEAEILQKELDEKHQNELDSLKKSHETKVSELEVGLQSALTGLKKEIENLQEQQETELAKAAADREHEVQEEKDSHGETIKKLEALETDHKDLVEQLSVKETEIEQLRADHDTKIIEQTAEFQAKVEMTREEVVAEKEHLALRESTLHAREELVTVKEEIATVQSAKQQPRTPPSRTRHAGSPTKSPVRSGSKIQRSGASRTPLRRAEALEIVEREKEGLHKQIKVLEAQAAEASQEHERTLRQFRTASEEEIVRLKKEVDRRQQEHATRDAELRESLGKVDSWEKQELLEKIDELEWDKKSDRTGGLREVQKKEDLLEQISLLEKNEQKLVEDHEQAVKELRDSSESEVQNLKEEIEKQRKEYSVFSSTISATSSFDKEDLVKMIAKLECDLETEKSAATLIKMKLLALEKEKCAIEASHLEELSAVRDRNADKMEELNREIEELKEKNESIESIEKEKEALEQQLQNLEVSLEEERQELVSLRAKHKEEIRQLTEESAKNLEAEAEDKIKKLREDQESILEALKTVHEEHAEKMVAEAKHEAKTQASEEGSVLRGKVRQMEETRDESRSLITELEGKLSVQMKESEDRVRKVNEKHTKELDELIGQLDLLESEQTEKFTKKDEIIADKEKIVDSLTEELAEATARADAAEESEKKIDELAEEAVKAQEEVSKLMEELESLRVAHEEYIAEAEELREQACDEAREEMIERAEIQFRQANELYVKLKKQYDSQKAKVDRLDGELKDTRRRMDSLAAEKSDMEVSLRAEVAHAHAGTAKVEADSAQKAKDYRREMEGLLHAAKDFEEKADAAESLSRNVQKTLAALVVAKDGVERAHDSLKQEHEEMKQVCEELMAELEGR